MNLRYRCTAWSVLLAAILLAGCSSMTGGAEVVLSPDGTRAAYVCTRQWSLPLPPECPVLRSRVWVRWCSLSRPAEVQSAEIGVFGRGWGGWFVQNRVHPVFSPGNRYLAVASPRSLLVLDAATGKGRTLTGPGEVVTSLVWLDAEQLAYASCLEEKRESGVKGSVRFWRQRPAQAPSQRELIFSQEEAFGCSYKGLGVTEWPRERWSPDGRFVLLPSSAPARELRLLNVAEKTSSVLATGYILENISWKSDGSEAACVGFKGGGPLVAFLLDPETGATHDFSTDFDGVFGGDSSEPAPWVDARWTPGDEYLVVNHGREGGCLVRPRPWEVVPAGKLLVDHIVREGAHVLAEDPSEWLPWVYRQPAEGWLKVWVPFQEERYRRGMDYLVDYAGGSVTALGESSAPGGGWRLTPDGTLAVMLQGSCELAVRRTPLPGPGR